MIHHVLEGCRGVTEAKVHDHWFIQTILGLKRRFMLVSLFDVYFIETPFDVELGEDERILYFSYELWYQREWVSVANRPLVNSSVVLYWSLRAISFSEKKRRMMRQLAK